MIAREAPDPQDFPNLDRIVHEPARFLIMKVLAVVDSADFVYLLSQTHLTQGNLSSHMMKLENAGYVKVKKEFVERKPRTLYKLTVAGKSAFYKYLEQMRGLLDS